MPETPPRTAERQQAAQRRPRDLAGVDLDLDDVRHDVIDEVLDAGPDLVAPPPGELHPERGATAAWVQVVAVILVGVLALLAAFGLEYLKTLG